MNGEQEVCLEENQSTYIPRRIRHWLENLGKISLQIIEIRTVPYLEEGDIERFLTISTAGRSFLRGDGGSTLEP